ncbi:MAG: hypothetical protein WAX77_10785 [Methylococcaceae bacterium]
MKRILQIGLGWGLALGIAGAIMVIVYLAAPALIEQNLDLRERTQRAEADLAYKKQLAEQELLYLKKEKELDLQMEERREQMRLKLNSENNK